MANTDQEFLDKLERDFPEGFWDHPYDLKQAPDIYQVGAQEKRVNSRGREEIVGFTIHTEYASLADAILQCHRMMTDPVWEKVLPETLRIKVSKPSDLIELEAYSILRQEILDGKKIFPIYLP